MLDDKDIEKLIEAQKEVFVTKLDLLSFKDEILKDFDNLQTSVDTYSRKADAYFQEMVMLSHKVNHHEKWSQKLADKLGITLEY